MPDISLTVNGAPRSSSVEARKTLADFLRDDLDLTGTHVGCEHGVCGACTVIVDGRAVRSCLMLAVQAAGSDVTTIEGLAAGGELGTLQQAMWDSHSFQCGFCTPGFVMTTHAFLQKKPAPSQQEIEDLFGGNLCRCTGYRPILHGVRTLAGDYDPAADQTQKQNAPPHAGQFQGCEMELLYFRSNITTHPDGFSRRQILGHFPISSQDLY